MIYPVLQCSVKRVEYVQVVITFYWTVTNTITSDDNTDSVSPALRPCTPASAEVLSSFLVKTRICVLSYVTKQRENVSK